MPVLVAPRAIKAYNFSMDTYNLVDEAPLLSVKAESATTTAARHSTLNIEKEARNTSVVDPAVAAAQISFVTFSSVI